MMQVGAATGSGGPVSEQSTRMDMKAAESYGPGRTEGAGRTSVSTGTMQRPRAGTRTGSVAYTGPVPSQKKSSILPWLLLIVVLIGAGTTVAILLMQQGNTVAPPAPTDQAGADAGPGPTSATDPTRGEPSKKTAKLMLTVKPHTAKVTVDGKAYNESDRFELGSFVRVVAEAEGYERAEKIVEVKDEVEVVDIVAEPAGQPAQIVIKPSDDKAEVWANGQRLGIGPQAFSGKLGQSVDIKIVSVGGAEITKKIVLDGTSLVAINIPGETLIAIDPASATITATPGTVEVKNPGLVVVKGIDIGTSFQLEAKAPGYKPLSQKVDQLQAQGTLTLKLDKEGSATVTPPCEGPDCKKPPPLTGKGSLVINARPWAQVTVNGKAYGTTPVSVKELPAGSYTIVFTKGQQKATRTVKVGGGKQAAVMVDFTTM